MNKGYSVYNQINVTTADPMKIVLMLYDGAINFVNQAMECTRNGDVKNKNIHANSARDIIMELNNSLNLEIGGEIAKNLRGLYLFMNRHLMTANWKNDVNAMQEVVDLLSSLKETWQEIYSQNNATEQTAKNPALQSMTAGIRI